MPIANEAVVRSVLSGFEERISNVVNRAWRDWCNVPDRARFIYPRTQANIVFDYICQHSLSEFADDLDIQMISKRGTLKFLFKGQVLIRFKKANSKGIGGNIPTKSFFDFVDPQLCIPGLLEDIHRVEICYRSDSIGLTLDNLSVVARNRTSKVWSYNIEEKDSTAQLVSLPSKGGSDMLPPVVVPKQREGRVKGAKKVT